MTKPHLLEDPSYPGRSGGYVARITGKLLHDSVALGLQAFFLPTPIPSSKQYFIFSGVDASGEKLYEVSREFYAAVFQRLTAVFSLDKDGTVAEKQIEYSGVQYTFRAGKTATPSSGIAVNVVQGASPRASA
jgi:hypothetical protein